MSTLGRILRLVKAGWSWQDACADVAYALRMEREASRTAKVSRRVA